MRKYHVELTETQRQELEAFVSRGRAPARAIQHAHVLLKIDRGAQGPAWSQRQIQEAYGVGESTIKRIARRFVEAGLHDALDRRPQPERPETRKINGEMEAYLIATTCRPAPEGYRRWSVRLLADRFVELAPEMEEGTMPPSRETIRRALKKNELKPWLRKQWCLPRRGGPDYVAAMEDVLSVYCRPYDPKKPQICLDECSKQLLSHLIEAEPMRPGKPERIDFQYKRHGVRNVFLLNEPLTGKRYTMVRTNRKRQDWALMIKKAVDEWYPKAEKLVLVQDNLNTHTIGSLYATFSPEEAERLSQKLELHYTPKHASWLNMAEIELSVLARQCLDRRIGNPSLLQQEVMAWQEVRNQAPAPINWRFTTADARIKLKRLYPTVK